MAGDCDGSCSAAHCRTCRSGQRLQMCAAAACPRHFSHGGVCRRNRGSEQRCLVWCCCRGKGPDLFSVTLVTAVVPAAVASHRLLVFTACAGMVNFVGFDWSCLCPLQGDLWEMLHSLNRWLSGAGFVVMVTAAPRHSCRRPCRCDGQSVWRQRAGEATSPVGFDPYMCHARMVGGSCRCSRLSAVRQSRRCLR